MRTAHSEIAKLPERVKVIDMSADFRLRDPAVYAEWYGGEHGAPHLLKGAVYGLTEHYAEEIKSARLVACPGCYPTAVLLALLPLAKGKLIKTDGIIIDAKSGVSGAGRTLKQNILFSEAGEGLSPYGIGNHRHVPEIEQELSAAAGSCRHRQLHAASRADEPRRALHLLCRACRQGDRRAISGRRSPRLMLRAPSCMWWRRASIPATQHVRGSNHCHIGVFADRIPGRAIVISAIDNLVKGSAGQALQNFNLMYGFDETLGLEQLPLFP